MEATGFRRLSTEECPSLSWPFTAMYVGASSESSSSETKKCLGVYKTALWEPLSVFIEECGVTPLSLANGRVKGGAQGRGRGSGHAQSSCLHRHAQCGLDVIRIHLVAGGFSILHLFSDFT